jgi:hypothetical protein
MFTIGFVVFSICAIVNGIVSTVMKIQVNRNLPEYERFSWWSRSTSGFYRKHRELFPDSSLYSIAQGSFWTAILVFAAMLLNPILSILGR